MLDSTYTQSLKQQLKNDYPHFYSQLFSYISSLKEKWFFIECYDIDSNGERFCIQLHNGKNQTMTMRACKTGQVYKFCIDSIK